MTLLSKKVLGVGLTLLGGLTLAHGASSGRASETLLGLVVLAIGVAPGCQNRAAECP